MAKSHMKIVAAATIIGGAMAAAVSASAALNLPTQNCSYMFNTNMKLGSRGTDVMNLQKVLNAYPQTRVAESGAGSPGMETTYFGPATRAAANKFQALHLVELGITAPTGNVFAGTRGLLNAICQVSNNPGQGNPGGNTGGTTGSVNAMLGGSQPTGMLVAGQAGARLADITFTGNGTVTSVQLQRTGVSSDTTLTNVYLYDGNTRLTDAASVVTGGYINFNSPSGLFTVSGNRTITVRADVASGTNGQSVGVRLNSVTANGSMSTFSNVVGNSLQIGSVTVAGVTVATTSLSSSVQAGAVNQNVWSATLGVSTRDVNLRAATFKFVGSAPVDAFTNVNLYVDGTKVAGPAMISSTNNNKVVFDLGYTPYLLRTGSHTMEVRADIVKGSNRTYQFSIENAADLMLEDSQLMGVNITPTLTNGTTAISQSNTAATTVTISLGSVTVNVDPAFNATKVTGGATNVPVGQFTLKAYGEDVKVNNLKVSIATTSPISTLNNVSLYVNGAQVGTSQNYNAAATAAGGLTFTLGSSLIIPANTTVTLTVKADVVDSNNAAYSSGTITASIGGVTQNAQGVSSSELISVASSAVTGNTLTVSSGAATFARTAGFATATTTPNAIGTRLGSFTLQAGSAEDIKVTSIAVNPQVSAMSITNLSNLRVMSSGATLGTPVGNPSSGTTTFSFSEITVPANGTRTFDVYADIGSATGTVTTDMAITYRGAVSNTTVTSSAAGVQIAAAVSSLGTPTLSASSPVSQYVVGGSTFGVATFSLKTATAGTVANVREVRFHVTTSNDAIESITVGGVTAPVVSGTSTVTGLSIPVTSSGTDVPVTVKYAGFQGSTSGGSLTTSIATTTVELTYVEATSGSGTVITSGTVVPSNGMSVVASKPTVTVSAGNTDTLVLGAENKVGEFTVTADANGKISIASTSLSVSAVGVTAPEFTSFRIADGNTTISSATWNGGATGSTTPVFTFSPAYEISAGQSKTFSVFATVAGTAQSGITPYVTSKLTSGLTFNWKDVVGGNTAQTGSLIYNFPTNSFTTKR